MDLYRRIAAVRSDDEASDLIDELVDRFGDVPGSVDNLVRIALLRAAAAQSGFSDIAQKGTNVNLTLRQMDLKRVSAVCADRKFKGKLLFHAGEPPVLTLRLGQGEKPLQRTQALVEAYGATQGRDEEE